MAFIAFLGASHIAQRMRANLTPPQPVKTGFTKDGIDCYIGQTVAKQLFSRTANPYEQIFHADHQGEMWETVNEILTPAIRIKIPRNVRKNAVKRMLDERLERMGLNADINLEDAYLPHKKS